VTVVISDVHLSQAHPEDPADPLWMRYRLREHHPDLELAGLVDHLLATRAGEAIELAFNGDVFDFDAPWVKDGTSSFDEIAPTEVGCAEQIGRILADHPGWLRATARLLAAGHRVLFLSGNHDVELYWPGVRQAVRDALACHAAELGAPEPERIVRERVRFRTWFHVTEDGIYLEHGSQYDALNGVRHPMLPLTRERDRIHPVTGKLAFRRTGARIGYLNPYDERTFYMGLSDHLAHYARYYARSPDRHVVRTWALGALETVLEVWRHRHHEDWAAEERELARAETGATERAIAATQALRVELAEDTMLPIVRQLWLDRAGLALLVGSAPALVGAALGPRRAAAAAAALALAFLGYEALVPKPDLASFDAPPPGVRALFDIHGVRALCFGHTHRPFGRWEGERFQGNSGSWAPAFRDPACLEPSHRARPVLVLSSDGGALEGGLYGWSWREGRLAPAPGAVRERAAIEAPRPPAAIAPAIAASRRRLRARGSLVPGASRSSCRPRSPSRRSPWPSPRKAPSLASRRPRGCRSRRPGRRPTPSSSGR
jgi:UDP-2,3-diacylglucosamine pyrophosphatase LpxH